MDSSNSKASSQNQNNEDLVIKSEQQFNPKNINQCIVKSVITHLKARDIEVQTMRNTIAHLKNLLKVLSWKNYDVYKCDISGCDLYESANDIIYCTNCDMYVCRYHGIKTNTIDEDGYHYYLCSICNSMV